MADEWGGVPCIKGVAFRTAFQTFVELYGPDKANAILMRLPQDLRYRIQQGLIYTGNWYPLEWYNRVYVAAQEVTGLGLELPLVLSRENIRKDLGRIYAIFIRWMSPEFVIGRAAKLFSTYYDTGTFVIREVRKGYARGLLTGCYGFNKNLWVGLIGGCEAALIASGEENIRFNVLTGGGDGDCDMEFEATWGGQPKTDAAGKG
jgi:hypothetical protein